MKTSGYPIFRLWFECRASQVWCRSLATWLWHSDSKHQWTTAFRCLFSKCYSMYRIHTTPMCCLIPGIISLSQFLLHVWWYTWKGCQPNTVKLGSYWMSYSKEIYGYSSLGYHPSNFTRFISGYLCNRSG